jgi:hypothetical protein
MKKNLRILSALFSLALALSLNLGKIAPQQPVLTPNCDMPFMHVSQ